MSLTNTENLRRADLSNPSTITTYHVKLPHQAIFHKPLLMLDLWVGPIRWERSADITTFTSFKSWIALIKHGLFAVCRLNWSISPCGLFPIVKQLLLERFLSNDNFLSLSQLVTNFLQPLEHAHYSNKQQVLQILLHVDIDLTFPTLLQLLVIKSTLFRANISRFELGTRDVGTYY